MEGVMVEMLAARVSASAYIFWIPQSGLLKDDRGDGDSQGVR